MKFFLKYELIKKVNQKSFKKTVDFIFATNIFLFKNSTSKISRHTKEVSSLKKILKSLQIVHNYSPFRGYQIKVGLCVYF